MKNIKKTFSVIIAVLMILSAFTFLASADEECNHIYEASKVDPDCVEAGYTLYVCPACSDNYKDYTNGGDPLGHNFGEWYEVNPASCSVEGVMKRDCGRCGGSDSKTISVLEHTDFDSNGECDECKAPVETNTIISPYDWLVALFNAIIQWFRDLFA